MHISQQEAYAYAAPLKNNLQEKYTQEIMSLGVSVKDLVCLTLI